METIETYTLALEGLDLESKTFYREAIELMLQSGIPFMIGGAYAFGAYTGIVRDTKDLDFFIMPSDIERTLQLFNDAGYKTDLEIPRWLGKAFMGDHFVDFIFGADNGIAMVDETWFEQAYKGKLLGVPVRLIPPEEMIWSKSYLMERYRYDGADILHLFHACSESLDWKRLLARFGAHWRLLFNYAVLFGFVYPSERQRIPEWVMQEFIVRLEREVAKAHKGPRICNGTLLAPTQYLHDLDAWHYQDPMKITTGMTTQEIVEAGMESGDD